MGAFQETSAQCNLGTPVAVCSCILCSHVPESPHQLLISEDSTANLSCCMLWQCVFSLHPLYTRLEFQRGLCIGFICLGMRIPKSSSWAWLHSVLLLGLLVASWCQWHLGWVGGFECSSSDSRCVKRDDMIVGICWQSLAGGIQDIQAGLQNDFMKPI